ncbi:hypothetical protein [Muricoccus radiodurans]|uniref:hypothetical protein n=1 Tax=Muricoccus radiodurans TaxID=2231721 RepID=UPI003CE93BE4
MEQAAAMTTVDAKQLAQAVELTRAQMHLLQTTMLGLIVEAAPEAREATARILERLMAAPPSPLIDGAVTAAENTQQYAAMGGVIVGMLRKDNPVSAPPAPPRPTPRRLRVVE